MYIPLFNKSNYSLLSSLLRIDDIVEYAASSNIYNYVWYYGVHKKM